jgi:dienelactone hydrolase
MAMISDFMRESKVYHLAVRRFLRSLLLVLSLTIVGTIAVAPPYVDSLAFIARAAAMPGVAGQLADWRAQAFVAEPIRQVPTRHGPVDVRMYRPASGPSRRTVTLVPGVHMDGIREARLVGMAEDLAASGFSVMTVATPDLQRFSITPTSTDIIEDAATWLADQQRAQGTGDGKIGMLGISFSGGLSLVAAGRPSLRDRVAFVMSFGGHGDLQRVMRYLCSGNAPTMPPIGDAKRIVAGAEHVSIRPPHDYGVAVVLLSLADRIVPTDQLEPLRRGILTFLAASSLDMVDKPRAEIEFKKARDMEAALAEPSRTLLKHVNDRAVDQLGPILLPAVESVKDAGEFTALSPERAPAPAAPVFLLHGAEDNVIPSVETVLLAGHLQGKTEVHAILSGLITHAEVDKSAAAIEVWRLVGFWKDLMEK